MPAILEHAPKAAVECSSRPTKSRKTDLQQRGRRILIAAFLLFVLSQLGLRWFIDQQRAEWRDPSFEIKYSQFARLKETSPKQASLVIFMGSSITASGMNADLCEGLLSTPEARSVIAFNFGTPCGGPFTQLVYVKRLLRRGVRPNLVVLELSPLFLDDLATPQDVVRFPGYTLEFADLATVRRYNRDDAIDEEWQQAWVVPVYGHRLAILNHASKSLVAFGDQLDLYKDASAHGWRKYQPKNAEEHARTLAGVRDLFGPRLAKHFVGSTAWKALDEVLALLAGEGIPTLLVRVPEGPLLRSFYSTKAAADLQRTFLDLSARHQFPLVDCSAWLDEDHFVDSYHMNHVGAEKLTRRLVDEQIRPFLRSR